MTLKLFCKTFRAEYYMPIKHGGCGLVRRCLRDYFQSLATKRSSRCTVHKEGAKPWKCAWGSRGEAEQVAEGD